VTRSTIEGTDYALDSVNLNGMAAITVSYCMITNNGIGWAIIGDRAVIKTLGNNHIADNGPRPAR
jgi:hypothetical protein